MRQRVQRGFTLVELLVSFSIIVVLSTIFLERIFFYQEQAERAAFNAVLNAMQTGLRLQHAMILIREGPKGLAEIGDINPVDVLLEPPPNYFGGLSEASSPRNGWYFDRANKLLIYRPNFHRWLTVSSGGDEIRFRVVVSGNGAGGIRLLPVEEYLWTQPAVN